MLLCKTLLRKISPLVVVTLCTFTAHAASLPISASVLPGTFAGWQLSGTPKVEGQPEGSEAQSLKEAGITASESAEYQRDGESLKIQLLCFNDASGAYSAYTLLRQPNWPKEQIGTGATSDNNRVLFWQSNIVVDATFSHISAMSAGELRELASKLPLLQGNANLPPPLSHYLPEDGLEPQSTRYSLGETTYTQGGGALPVDLIGFDRGAEVLSGSYRIQGNEGVLTLIEYPTPQLAAEREKAIAAFFKAGNPVQNHWPQALADSNPLALSVRRTGPVLAITTGGLFDRQAAELAGRVYYQAEVSWTRSGPQASEISKTAKLLIGIVMLVAVLGGTSLILGIFFGGGRLLYRRLRGKSVLDDEEQNKFLSLNLSGLSEEPLSKNSDSVSEGETGPKANG
jgi:hypothetical protein